MKTFEEYQQQIKVATTAEELDRIQFEAFHEDPAPIDYNYLMGGRPKTLSDKVAFEVTKRKVKLGLLPADAAKRPTKAERNAMFAELDNILPDFD